MLCWLACMLCWLACIRLRADGLHGADYSADTLHAHPQYDPFGDTSAANMWADTYTTNSTNPIQSMTGF